MSAVDDAFDQTSFAVHMSTSGFAVQNLNKIADCVRPIEPDHNIPCYYQPNALSISISSNK